MDRARGIVRMEGAQDEVAGQGRLDGDLRGLEVTNLADEDDVRVLPQERTQRAREVEPDVVVHLDLIDSEQVVLDRILGRGDVRVRLVELRQGRIERRRLSGTGGPGDQDHPVREMNALPEAFESLLFEPKLRHVE